MVVTALLLEKRLEYPMRRGKPVPGNAGEEMVLEMVVHVEERSRDEAIRRDRARAREDGAGIGQRVLGHASQASHDDRGQDGLEPEVEQEREGHRPEDEREDERHRGVLL